MQNLEQQEIELYQLKTGTTTLALKFKDGVIIASDQQVTTYYKAGKIKKIFMITNVENFIGVSIAGSASDAVNLIDVLRSELKLYRFENGFQASVKTATSLLSTILYTSFRRFQPYLVHFLIGGVDTTGSHIFSIDMIGSITDDWYASTGSGSIFALSKLEDSWKVDMSREQATSLAIQAIKLAANRDLYTGYGIDLVIITKDGPVWERRVFTQVLDS